MGHAFQNGPFLTETNYNKSLFKRLIYFRISAQSICPMMAIRFWFVLKFSRNQLLGKWQQHLQGAAFFSAQSLILLAMDDTEQGF